MNSSLYTYFPLKEKIGNSRSTAEADIRGSLKDNTLSKGLLGLHSVRKATTNKHAREALCSGEALCARSVVAHISTATAGDHPQYPRRGSRHSRLLLHRLRRTIQLFARALRSHLERESVASGTGRISGRKGMPCRAESTHSF